MAIKKAEKTDAEPDINRAVDDPHGLARSWLAGVEGRGHGVRVAHHRGEFLKWDGDAYREIAAGDLRKQLAAHAEREFVRANRGDMKAWADRAAKGEKPPVLKKVGTRLVADVLQALAGECHLPGDIGPPAWVTDAGTVDADRAAADDPRIMLAMPSGLLNLRDAAYGWDDCLRPPSPHFFTRTAVGYDYSAGAKAPHWGKFLNEVFGVTAGAKAKRRTRPTRRAGRASGRCGSGAATS